MRDDARRMAELLRLIANENRLLILCALLERPMTVGELAEQLGCITLPALSQHLQRLRQGQLVQAQKHGQYVIYTLQDQRMEKLIALLKQEYCS